MVCEFQKKNIYIYIIKNYIKKIKANSGTLILNQGQCRSYWRSSEVPEGVLTLSQCQGWLLASSGQETGTIPHK